MKPATFSIIAFDPATGDLGVGVESHAFTAGAAVPYAIAGVGAVATQAAANRLYGPKAIELLKQGLSPTEVVKRLTDDDAGRDTRQLAIIDAKGRSAVYTGRHVIDRNSDVNDLVHLGGMPATSRDGITRYKATPWPARTCSRTWRGLTNKVAARWPSA